MKKMDFKKSVNGNIFIYVSDMAYMISAEFGTGDYLTLEDIDSGYDAYINYYEYDMRDILISGEIDGGMMLYNSQTTDYHTNIKSLADDLLEHIYGEIPEYSIICAPESYLCSQ